MSQFGSFDGRDNRKSVINLLARIGRGLSERQKAERRALFLRRLMCHAEGGLAGAMIQAEPMGLTDSYFAFTALTGVLGVPIMKAIRLLEEEVRRR